MPSKAVLRTVIVLELSLFIIGNVVSVVTESWLPEPLRAFVANEFNGEISSREIILVVTGIPLAIVSLVSRIGLFFFWRPARMLYAITVGAALLAKPFFGPYVDAGLGAALEEAALALSGVIVALVYLSPLKQLYEGPAGK